MNKKRAWFSNNGWNALKISTDRCSVLMNQKVCKICFEDHKSIERKQKTNFLNIRSYSSLELLMWKIANFDLVVQLEVEQDGTAFQTVSGG